MTSISRFGVHPKKPSASLLNTFSLLFSALGSVAAQTIDIRGTVTDRFTLKPLAHAQVTLVSSGLADTTDTSGNFHLFRAPTGVRPSDVPSPFGAGLRLSSGRLSLFVPSAGMARFRILDLAGKVLGSGGAMAQPSVVLEFPLPALEPGLYFVQAVGPDFRLTERVFLLPGSLANALVPSGSPPPSLAAAKTSAAVDTLRVEKDGYRLDNIPIESWTQTEIQVAVSDTAAAQCVLQSLGISTGQIFPAFQPGTLAFSASVGDADSSVVLKLDGGSGKPSLRVNGTLLDSGEAELPLALAKGPNTVTVTSVSRDSSCSQETRLQIHRAFGDSTGLQLLDLTGGTLEPAFHPSVLNYRVALPQIGGDFSLTLQAFQPLCILELSGNPVARGSLTTPVSITAQKDTVVIGIRSPDLSKLVQYSIEFYRPTLPGKDFTLSNLVLSPKSGNIQVFDPADMTYSFWMEALDSVVTITPTLNDPAAKMTVLGLSHASGTPVTYTLPMGRMLIPIIVTTADGSTSRAYNLYFHRSFILPQPLLIGPDSIMAGDTATFTTSGGTDPICGSGHEYATRFNFGDTAYSPPIYPTVPGRRIYMNAGQYSVKAEILCRHSFWSDSVLARSPWTEPILLKVMPVDSVSNP